MRELSWEYQTVRWAQRSAMMGNMKELSRQYECDGLSVYGASLRCAAQLLVLELVIVKLVQTVGIKRKCLEFRMEMLVEDVARVEQLATTYRILRYAAAILDLATAQADAHVSTAPSA